MPDPHILLISEVAECARVIAAALERTGVPHLFTRASSPEHAISLLSDGEQFFRANPHLILLDLHTPGRDGFEMLTYLKRSPLYRAIPVVVLSRCAVSADVRKAYDLNANAFVLKPPEFEGLVEVLDSICRFWLKVAAR